MGEAEGIKLDIGWAFPANSRKAHYIDKQGFSLCRKYGFVPDAMGMNDDPFKTSSDDCVICRRKFDRLYRD